MSEKKPRHSIDWQDVSRELDDEGYAIIRSVLSASACRTIVRYYEDSSVAFRSTIDMTRFGFGQGQYKYFDYPLPEPVQRLRETFYPPLSIIANEWSSRLGNDEVWPDSLTAFSAQCYTAGQTRPTPLLLRYSEGDYNCLHQDLYGPKYFPLQAVCLLSKPGIDFEGGELILVEQRPRMQSRPIVVPMGLGDVTIMPLRDRPRQGAKRVHRSQMRHGVGRLRRGNRMTLGLIFHDAK